MSGTSFIHFRDGIYSSFGSVPQPPTNSPTASPRKLQKAELQSMVARIAKEKKKAPELEPLVPKLTLSKAVIQKSADRLSARASARDAGANLSVHLNAPLMRSGDEILETAIRLHDTAVQHQIKVAKDLHEKFVQQKKYNVLNEEQIKATNDRNYYDTLKRRAENKAALVDKYVTSKLPKVPPRSEDDWKTTAARLSKKEHK